MAKSDEFEKNYPVGVSDYAKLVSMHYHHVDKSLAIWQMLREGSDVVILTRPRRFGKTLFMSMLETFCANEVNSRKTAPLFENTLIKKKQPDFFNAHQGKYSVIFISLREIKSLNITDAQKELAFVLQECFIQHANLLEENKLAPEEVEFYQRIKSRKASGQELQRALKYLSRFLKKTYDKPVVILIDEYDTPIQAAYTYHYYDEMIKFMRVFFDATLKDNTALYKSVITGITRIAKESLFSGLNNPAVYTVLDDEHGDSFGFTETEVKALLASCQQSHLFSDIKKWYNGYHIGSHVIYNPWSIISCLNRNGKLQPYWINTSTNDLLKILLARASDTAKVNLKKLMYREEVIQSVDLYTDFSAIEKSDTALWHLLLSSGYLTANHIDFQEIEPICHLKIPNEEILRLFKAIVKNWFKEISSVSKYEDLVHALVHGEAEEFSMLLQQVLETSASYFDTSGKEPEKFYHGLILGLTLALEDSHQIFSNREAGYGRYDLVLIPKDHDAFPFGIVLEFKRPYRASDLKKSAKEALSQIKQKHYLTEITHSGAPKALLIGLAFYGKTVESAHEICDASTG